MEKQECLSHWEVDQVEKGEPEVPGQKTVWCFWEMSSVGWAGGLDRSHGSLDAESWGQVRLPARARGCGFMGSGEAACPSRGCFLHVGLDPGQQVGWAFSMDAQSREPGLTQMEELLGEWLGRKGVWNASTSLLIFL